MNAQNSSGSLSLIRFIGYGFFAVSLIYLLDLFLPPRFTDPSWEYSTAALLLERTPLPLLGLVMVFWGEFESRHKWEVLLLKVLSWATLGVGLLYFLLIPLGVSAGARLNTQNISQLNSQYEQQVSQLDQAQERLDNATSEELNLLFESLSSQNPDLESLTPGALKTQLEEEIAQTRQTANSMREKAQRSQSLDLLKSSAKLVALSLIFGFLFMYVWLLTAWCRQLRRQTKGQAPKRLRS